MTHVRKTKKTIAQNFLLAGLDDDSLALNVQKKTCNPANCNGHKLHVIYSFLEAHLIYDLSGSFEF